MAWSDQYINRNYNVFTVALYGSYEPFYFQGHLFLRTYYKDNKKNELDNRKSSDYLIDTLFYETNKVIRSRIGERYDEQRALVIQPSNLLGEPYCYVFNRMALTTDTDNTVSLVKDNDAPVRGLVLVVKKVADGEYTWLEKREAREIEKTLKAILNK